MNKQDRNRLLRVRELLGAVPFGADVWRTSLPSKGALAYQEEMRGFVPCLQKILDNMLLLCYKETCDQVFSDEHPDRLLTILEDWVVTRKREDWETFSVSSVATFAKLWRGEVRTTYETSL